MRTHARCHSLLIVAAVTAALAGCGSDEPGADEPAVEEAGFGHVHALDRDPRDGAVLIATHAGLFRAPPGDRTAARVGDHRHDLMGFSVAAPDRFVASGHPDGSADLPPFLGLVESRDGGRTWEPVSLLGEVDFHVLEVTGERAYAFGSEYESGTATMRVSRDGGDSWREASPPEPLLALAIDPADPDSAVAAGEEALYRTADGADTWRALGGPVGLLAWPAPDELYSVTLDGVVARSADGGTTFEQVANVDGDPASLHAERGGELHLALHDGTILRSLDGGESWAVRARL